MYYPVEIKNPNPLKLGELKKIPHFGLFNTFFVVCLTRFFRVMPTPDGIILCTLLVSFMFAPLIFNFISPKVILQKTTMKSLSLAIKNSHKDSKKKN